MVEKFPNDPLAVDAQTQIGYIWFAATAPNLRPDCGGSGATAFQDFLFRYPKSEKAAQARENLALLDHRLVKGSLEIAKYYDKAKNYRAAVLYYNEVIRQQPGSPESAIAKTRIEQLRSKVGDAALQSAAEIAERRAKNNPQKNVAKSSGEAPSNAARAPIPPDMRGNPNDLAPLPPPADFDTLPPPAATGGSTDPDASITPTPSPTPETAATP